MDMTGLIVVTQMGHEWRWVDWDEVENAAGKLVRVEMLERPCKLCAEPFTVMQKLPQSVFKRAAAARSRPPKPTRRIYRATGRTESYGPPQPFACRVTLTSRYGNLQVVTCRRHRWMRELPVEELV